MIRIKAAVAAPDGSARTTPPGPLGLDDNPLDLRQATVPDIALLARSFAGEG